MLFNLFRMIAFSLCKVVFFFGVVTSGNGTGLTAVAMLCAKITGAQLHLASLVNVMRRIVADKQVNAELVGLICYIKQLLATFIASLDEGMGGKSSKHGTDSDNKKSDRTKKRRAGSDGIPTKAVPPMGLSNIEDSPFLTRTPSGMTSACHILALLPVIVGDQFVYRLIDSSASVYVSRDIHMPFMPAC